MKASASEAHQWSWFLWQSCVNHVCLRYSIKSVGDAWYCACIKIPSELETLLAWMRSLNIPSGLWNIFVKHVFIPGPLSERRWLLLAMHTLQCLLVSPFPKSWTRNNQVHTEAEETFMSVINFRLSYKNVLFPEDQQQKLTSFIDVLRAAQGALESSGMSGEDIDMVIVATSSPEDMFGDASFVVRPQIFATCACARQHACTRIHSRTVSGMHVIW